MSALGPLRARAATLAVAGLMLFAPAAALAQASPSAHTSAARYDLEHRVTGAIAPDPDGAGTIRFAATRNSYDARGLLVKVESGELANWQAESIAPANWSGFTLFRTVDYAYDALGRNTARIVPERAGLAATHSRDVYTSYDNRGLVMAVRFDTANGAEGVATSYDAAGRMTSSSTTMDGTARTLSYTLNRNGARIQLSSTLGVTSYGYDGLGRLTAIYGGAIGAGPTLVSYAYNARSELTSQSAQNGVVTTLTHDALSRLSSLAHDLAGTGADSVTSLTRNPASQIITRARSNDAYTYNGDVAVNRAYAVNGLNQYVSAGPASFTYDANGNLTGDGATTYTYDIENRLVSAVGASSAALRYDPLGRLYETSGGAAGITRFLYDGDELLVEFDGAGTFLRSYLHGLGDDDPVMWYEAGMGSTRFLHADERGSIVAVSGNSGALIAVNRYDEWGVPDATNLGRFGFTGQAWLPELGMFYYKARIYSPTLGRFLQTDPIGYADQINLYAYVGNDPINARDPTGEDALNCTIVDGEVTRCILTADDNDTTELTITATRNYVDANGESQTSETTYHQSFQGSISNPSFTDQLLGVRTGLLNAISQNLSAFAGREISLNYSEESAAAESVGSVLGGVWGGSRPQDAGRGRGANRADRRQVSDVAREFGIDRRAFGRYVERIKEQEGRGGADNYLHQELRQLAQDFLRTGGH